MNITAYFSNHLFPYLFIGKIFGNTTHQNGWGGGIPEYIPLRCEYIFQNALRNYTGITIFDKYITQKYDTYFWESM